MVFSPVGAAYIADIAPVDLRGRYQAAWAFTFSLGLMLAPIGGTLLYSLRPSLLWVTCLCLCLAAAALMASAWLGERRSLGREETEPERGAERLAIVRAGNGLLADEHEFTVTPEGIAYIDAFSPVKANLASAGGSASGIALDGVIQQLDVRTGLQCTGVK